MAIGPIISEEVSLDHSSLTSHIDAPELRCFMLALFFIFSGINSLNDMIIPKLKELLTLSYTQAMLVRFCFFTAYAVIGIPAAMLVRKVGYMRGAAAGLSIMIAACLAFIPASQNATYWLFLAAYFVLAVGVVIVQVFANQLINLLGKPDTTSEQLKFAQAFNSLGTALLPIAGSALILGSLASVSVNDLTGAALDTYHREESSVIVHGYLGIAVALAFIAGAVWLFRNRLPPSEDRQRSEFLVFEDVRHPPSAHRCKLAGQSRIMTRWRSRRTRTDMAIAVSRAVVACRLVQPGATEFGVHSRRRCR